MFAIMIHEEMICKFAGVRNIARKAHAAILNGEEIENVRFRFSKEMDEYFRDIPGMTNIIWIINASS